MNNPMKILIGYDGSACSNDALHDLNRAGLPDEADVRVLTVAEAWVPEPAHLEESTEINEEDDDTVQGVLRRQAHKAIDEARKVAETAAERLRKQFSAWQVQAVANSDSPALGILRMADLWKPDLIVIGSHGRSALTRMLIGSVSQKVLTETHSSVRIARRQSIVEGSPVRIVIGTDGTPDAEAAVSRVAARKWPEGSSIRVIAAHGPLDVDVAVPPFNSYKDFSLEKALEERYERLVKTVSDAAGVLRNAGLTTTGEVIAGTPAQTLLHHAEEWGADSIFVGARGHGFFERFLLGSVSWAVAVRAHCSVEVVRTSLPREA
jgi:nucleotide-binding universal stress UspA family protein